MQVLVRQQDDLLEIMVEGRMDAATVKDFEDKSQEALSGDDSTKKMLVDFSNLEFISSAGLRGVLSLVKDCGKMGISLAFVGLTPMVADIFKIAGFDFIVKIYPDKATALTKI